MKDIGILKLLCETAGATGYEKNISVIVKTIFEKFCDEVITDRFSNVIGVMKAKVREVSSQGEKPIKIMFTAHMDEIGMLVTKVENGGFVKITKISGVDPKTLTAKKVIIHTAKKPVKGIVTSIPPHLTSAEDRKKAPDFDELYVDTGLSDEEAGEIIFPGDVVTYAPSFETQGMNMVSGKSLDDRAGIFTLIKTMQILKERSFGCDVIFLAAVSEEFNSLGAAAGTYRVEPDLSVVVDVTHGKVGAADVSDEHQLFSLGKGPVVCKAPILSSKLTNGILEICREKGVRSKIEVDNRDTGTDAFYVSVAKKGCATALLSLPLKYMHTQVEMINLKDIEMTAEIMADLVLQSSAKLKEYICY